MDKEVTYTIAQLREAEDKSAKFQLSVMRREKPIHAIPMSYMDALNHIVGVGTKAGEGKKYGELLRSAWLDGVIPEGFDEKADAYFAEMRQKIKEFADRWKQAEVSRADFMRMASGE